MVYKSMGDPKVGGSETLKSKQSRVSYPRLTVVRWIFL